jgi:hypothetical protein
MRIAAIAKASSAHTCGVINLGAIPRLRSVWERFLPACKNRKKKR